MLERSASDRDAVRAEEPDPILADLDEDADNDYAARQESRLLAVLAVIALAFALLLRFLP